MTGAWRRLGRAVAEALTRRGMNLVAHFKDSAEEAETLASEARALSVQAWTLQADLERTDEAEALARRAVELAGKLDYVVNSAAIFPDCTS